MNKEDLSILDFNLSGRKKRTNFETFVKEPPPQWKKIYIYMFGEGVVTGIELRALH